MKNIHVIPTDKPSRLGLCNNQLVFLPKHQNILVGHKNYPTINQNIYITHDEEIKEGDYVILKSGRLTKAEIRYGVLGFQTIDGIAHLYFQDGDKKIILTTDPELIKDGIQFIREDFLEWFVKNPTCEVVEIGSILNRTDGISVFEYSDIALIPKTTNFKTKSGVEFDESIVHGLMVPKEYFGRDEDDFHNAIKAYSEKEYSTPIPLILCVDFAKFGAKWQAERMYTEKDMEKAFNIGFSVGYSDNESPSYLTFEKWIEQNKKKKKMKNLHLITTDKLSRLFKNKTTSNLVIADFRVHPDWETQHIYIITDDEIKKGDYKYCSNTEQILKAHKLDTNNICTDCKKIILTTDQDLIKDGVQGIPDDFLEWFVNNPNCESVEIGEKEYLEIEKELGVDGHDTRLTQDEFNVWLKDGGEYFKIIIPKEKANYTQAIVNEAMKAVSKDIRLPKIVREGLVKEESFSNSIPKIVDVIKLTNSMFSNKEEEFPMQWLITKIESSEEYKKGKCTCKRPDDYTCDFCDAKQTEQILKEANKTLDGAAEYAVLSNSDMRATHSMGEFGEEMFKQGTKWQTERMYSEEDLLQLLNFVSKEYNVSNGIGWFHSNESIEDVPSKEVLIKWFEQLKKKL